MCVCFFKRIIYPPPCMFPLCASQKSLLRKSHSDKHVEVSKKLFKKI